VGAGGAGAGKGLAVAGAGGGQAAPHLLQLVEDLVHLHAALHQQERVRVHPLRRREVRGRQAKAAVEAPAEPLDADQPAEAVQTETMQASEPATAEASAPENAEVVAAS
jgi:hypothetical protein